MNLTFSITSTFEKEFTTSNLVNADLVIERVSCVTDKRTIGSRVAEGNLNLGNDSSSRDAEGICLMLDTINNMQEGVVTDNSAGCKAPRQSPMVCINSTWQSDHINVVVPKTRKWRFYITNKEGQYISLKTPMFVSIHFSIRS